MNHPSSLNTATPQDNFWFWCTDFTGMMLNNNVVPSSFQASWEKLESVQQLGDSFRKALDAEAFPLEWIQPAMTLFDADVKVKVLRMPGMLCWMAVPLNQSDNLYLKYEALFHSSFQFNGLLNPDGKVIEINNTAYTFGGFPKEEVEGKFLWEIPFWLHSADRIQVRLAVEKAARGTVVSFETQIQNHEHEIAYIDFSIKPIYNQQHELLFLLPQGREVTQFVEKNRALTRLTDLFNQAQAISHLGGWEYFPETAHFDWTDEVYRIFNRTLKTPLDLNDLGHLVHTQDRDFFMSTIHQVLDLGRECDLEFRVQSTDQPAKWVRVLTKSVFDQDGRLTLVRGIFQDVTEKKLSEFRKERTRQMIQHIGDAVVEMDPSGQFTFVSPGAERIFGQHQSSFLHQSIYTWIHSEHKEAVRDLFVQVINEQSSQLLTFKFLHPTKGYIWLDTTAVGYERPDGEHVLLLTARDVSQQLLLQDKLAQHERLLESVAKATGLLLRVSDLQEALFQGLALLGEATKVDRVYVFRNGQPNAPEALFTSQWMEWNSGSALPQIDNPDLQDIPFEAVSAFMEPLKERRAFSVRVKDLDSGQLRDLLEAQEILTLLVLPVFIKNHFWGFIGFDDCTHMRTWTEAETHVLLSFTESVAAAITRNALEKDLLETSRIAQEASRLKGEFLTNMSHEIRTPLNGIVGFTELLLTTETTDRQKQYLNSVHTAANTLLHLINDILDFSKIEAGKLELVPEETDMTKLAEKAIEVVRYAAYQNQLTLVLDLAPDLPQSAICDGGRLLQVLVNLLGNAVKFTEKGEVVLHVYSTPAESPDKVYVHFGVKDTGIGIPIEKQAHIFELFSQADSSITRKYGGTGLGLNITTNLLHRMGSHLEFESEPGKGSHFYFTLPLDLGSTEPSIPSTSIQHIWMLEPHKTSAQVLEKWLTFAQVQVTRFTSFEEITKQWLQGTPPDMLLLAQSSLPLDRADFAEWLKRNPGRQDTSVVVMGYLPWTPSQENETEESFQPIFLPLPAKKTELYHLLQQKQSLPLAESARPESGQRGQDALDILVAEDNELNMLLVNNMLKRHFPNAQIFAASSGLEAVAAYTRVRPHLVLMDIQMPELDGLEATRQIRMVEGEAGLPTVPIIALTAGVLLGEKERALESGMQGFISKPFVEKELIQAIQRVLPNRWFLETSEDQTDIFSHFHPAFNQERLKAQFGTDIQYMAMIFAHFVPLIGPDVEAIEWAAKAHDVPQLMRSIHKIKSNFSMVGLLEVEKACLSAEHQLMNVLDFPEAEIQHLIQLLNQALGFITQENQRLTSFLKHD